MADEENPYAPPQEAPAGADNQPWFRPMEGIGRTLRICLFVNLGLMIPMLAGSLLDMKLTYSGEEESPAAEAFYMGFGIFVLAFAVFSIVLIVIFAKWICRGHRNLRVLGATGLRTSPRWAVGWFFVPIAMLWKPYVAMKDLWKASHDPSNWLLAATPGYLGFWWTLWLVTNFIDSASFRIAMRTEDPGLLTVASGMDAVSALLSLPLSWVAAHLVDDITRAQTAQARDQGLLLSA